MRKFTTHSIKALGVLMMVIASLLFSSDNVSAQAATYIQETFAGPTPNLPTLGMVNFKVDTFEWNQDRIVGPSGSPNNFVLVNASTLPIANNVNIAGFPVGANFVKCGNGVLGNTAGNSAFMATRALDFSGHTVYNALSDTLGFAIWRDNTAGMVNVLDYIEVYISTTRDLSGAMLLKEYTTNQTKIYRSTTQTPLGGINGWNWAKFKIDTTGVGANALNFVGPNASSNAHIIVVAYSAGGNNMYLDNFNMPVWRTNMVVTSAVLFSQSSLDVGKGSTNNEIASIRITTRGSVNPIRLEGASFSANGSNNFTVDVTNSRVWFTGAQNTLGTSGNALQMPRQTSPSVPLGLGYLEYGCNNTCTPCQPSTFTLNTGTENYIFLVYDIALSAVSGDIVGCDFEAITLKSALNVCSSYGLTGLGVTTPQTFGLGRYIDVSYFIPVYSAGSSYQGYNQNDFVSAVELVGDNGSRIRNYFHDNICNACLSGGTNCYRVGCHTAPYNDYTIFAPTNIAGPGPAGFPAGFRDRFVQLTSGKGVRSGSPAYTLYAQAGSWPFNSNNIVVMVDWNKDGDFDDTYTTGGVSISENYGTRTMLNGDLTSFPVASWAGINTWVINVPNSTGETVTDAGADPASDLSRNTSQLFLGNVRLRVREVFAANPIGYTTNYTWGETEDYTIQVLPDCPSPSSDVCKWIGQDNDWNNPGNWCPSIPTLNKVAYIPVVSAPYVYPTILSGTNAEMRQLNISDGAMLKVDAPQGGSMKVLDDVNIGWNNINSTAAININSTYSPVITIPGKTSVPPAGLALVPISPFRTNSSGKTQIVYKATELIAIYGWKSGDIVDQISIEVASMTPGLGPDTLRNFRIRAFLRSPLFPTVYPFPAPPNTKIALEAGDPGVVAGWPRTIFTANPLVLNMPNVTWGTQFNGNYQTFTLVPNTFVWDGVSDVILSIEYYTPGLTLPPARSYVLYDEPNGLFNVLALNAVFNLTVNGWNIDGSGHWSGGSNVAAGLAVVSSNRPRLDFKLRRPYQVFPITVGGDWVNNNRNPTATYPSISGAAGFVAGYSKVTFDPNGRASVSSPGLTSANATYYTGTPGIGLLSNVDQDITSGGNSSTVFNQLVINKTGTGVVKQSSGLATLVGAYADSLSLTAGEFKLNRKEFTLTNSSPSYLVSAGGWLRSEDNSSAPLGVMQSKFTWNIASGFNGAYTIPFKGASATLFNLVLTKTNIADNAGMVTFATYGTPNNNTSFAIASPSLSAVDSVKSMTSSIPSLGVNATPWTVDRFWYVKRTTNTPLAGNIRFEYDNTQEGTLQSVYASTEMKAQRYGTTGWKAPFPGQSDGSSAPKAWVIHPLDSISDTYPFWVVVRINALQGPLPLTLLSFGAKAIDHSVKTWWSVQDENESVSRYVVEKTTDINNTPFESFGFRNPVGPASYVQYELYDEKPEQGNNYYRLNTLSVTGENNYSNIVLVKFGTTSTFAINNVISNTNGDLTVNFVYDSKLPCSYLVIDVLGKVIASGKVSDVQIGNNIVEIPAYLSQGVYTITLANDEKRVSQKLVN